MNAVEFCPVDVSVQFNPNLSLWEPVAKSLRSRFEDCFVFNLSDSNIVQYVYS